MTLHRVASGLVFHEPGHQYVYRGVQVPSVTSIIPRENYDMVPAATLEYARQRGSAVDMALQLWIANELDEDSLDPVVVPYMRAYMQFVMESGWRTLAVQPRLYCPMLKVAGTADEVGWLNGRRTIVDWKATDPLPKSVSMQVGAYGVLWNACYPKERVVHGSALHLRSDGTYRWWGIDTVIWGERFRRRVQEWRNDG